MTRNVFWSGSAVFTVLLLIVILFFPSFSQAARLKPLHTGKDVKGLTFEEFWTKAREEAAKWGGTRLKVRRILSLAVIGFDGRNGRSPAWEAQFVRCDKMQQVQVVADDEEEGVVTVPGKACKGRTITLRMIESGVTGTATGLQISKETHFNGISIPLDRIMISPQKAEDAANSYKQYSPVETDTYAYELKYDQRKNKPVWVIKRTCGYKGKAEGRCIQGDYWIVKVDAESGEIVKPEKNPKRSRIEKQHEEEE